MDLLFTHQTLQIDTDECRLVEGGYIATASSLGVRLPAPPVRYLYSGWQSWSLTAWVDLARPVRPMRPDILHAMQTDPLYAVEKRPHGSWYGAVEYPDGHILFIGSLSLEAHVLLDGQTLRGWYETGTGEWFIASGEEEAIFSRYAALLAERLGRDRAKAPLRVWCSWYSLYTSIHEAQLLTALQDQGDLPFDVFLVDDGWQVAVGDWEPNQKFPSGMDGMASRIKATGRKAGLWLAPLLAARSSQLYREHRDWLLHDAQGRLVTAGIHWGSPYYALDTTHPGVLEWLAALMHKVRSWGYDYVKLDFLSAGALPGRRTCEMPRESAYRQGLEVMRAALGEAYLLVCGCPILPSLGLCDAMRIGPDVAEHWATRMDDDLLGNFAIPGTRNALRTTLHRLWLAPLVQIDPDIVYFRSYQNLITPAQRALLQSVAEICNFKACSDYPAWLSGDERQELHRFLLHQPKIEKIRRSLYQIDGRQVDFQPYLALPPLPGAWVNLQGAFLNQLLRIKPLFSAFDRIVSRSQERKLLKRTR